MAFLDLDDSITTEQGSSIPEIFRPEARCRFGAESAALETPRHRGAASSRAAAVP